jgi:CRP-like cAMP-binding protein
MNMISIMLSELAPLLDGLPGHELAFSAGASVFHRGDAVSVVHFVREGIIHLVRYQEEGSALILQRATSGSILAEASVYSVHYHCDARAETAAVTWAIARNVLRRHLDKDPVLSHAWARHLASEVQRARLHAEILSLKTVAARLHAWMAWNGPLPRKGARMTVADEIGVSAEALYREISRRRSHGSN